MSYDAHIERQSLNALFDIKGSSKEIEAWFDNTLLPLPTKPNVRSAKDNVELYHIGRNHWLMRAPLSKEDAIDAKLRPTNCPGDISIVRVSDTLTFFRVTGDQALDIMAIACPLDLHETAFGSDAVTFTEAFGLKALIMRCDGGFEFAVEQSFGDMVEDYLSRAKG